MSVLVSEVPTRVPGASHSMLYHTQMQLKPWLSFVQHRERSKEMRIPLGSRPGCMTEGDQVSVQNYAARSGILYLGGT